VKKLYVLIFSALPLFCFAQPPGYYNSASGLTGTPLRSALHLIIDNHNAQTYPLWTHFAATDAKGSTIVWDIYSDIPGQTPPYQYHFGGSDQCGNYNAEGDCFNHEHSWPQSYFNEAMPMKSDLFHVYPSDGWVNGKRANFAFGEVSNPNYTSLNGCKLGPNTYPGFSGTAFEPIDSFKGDFARSYFYMATRYYTEDGGWLNWDMANGAELKQWAINMLLEWHHNDPVSQKEKDRNEAIYTIQNNRNPFIDQPEFADCIWGICNTSVAGSPALSNIKIYPVPAVSTVTIEWEKLSPAESIAIDVADMQGRQIYHYVPAGSKLTIPVSDWSSGIYMLQISSGEKASYQKLIVW
jgi:endonuclease I